MNSVTQSILANQATESAKVLEQRAGEARQLAIIEDSKIRCGALIREFNEAPLGLQQFSHQNETPNCRNPKLATHSTTSSSAFDLKNIKQFIELGMRVYLVWRASYLVATFNAERAHPMNCKSVRGLSGEAFSEAHRTLTSSNKLMSLEDVVEAVQSRYVASLDDPDCAAVGKVLDNGQYTSCVKYVDQPKDAVFSLPANFISAVIQRMAPFLVVLAPVEPVKAKKGKK